MTWFWNLLSRLNRRIEPEPHREPWGDVKIGLTRQRLTDHVSTHWATGRVFNCPQYRYYCPCGASLQAGPCGGESVNAVCKPCKINYGCLPDWEHS